jgi:hypothetical protein
MKTQVLMERRLFDVSIKQQSSGGFFSATDLVNAGNKWRLHNDKSLFNLSMYLKSKSFCEFKDEMESKYGNVIINGRGRNSATWVHPLIFIDIALAINPKLKIEVYEWLFDNLIKFRNDSGDSYKEMCAALYIRFKNKSEFHNYIINVANRIKKSLGVSDWQKASEEELRKRDLIHISIKLLCNVLNDTDKAVELGIIENL